MVDQMNRWIHSGQGFIGSFDLPWSEWSRITDPDPDRPKGTHTKGLQWWWWRGDDEGTDGNNHGNVVDDGDGGDADVVNESRDEDNSQNNYNDIRHS